MKGIKSGRLKHRATFRRRSNDGDGYGNVDGDFSDFLSVWSNLRETPGKERLAAGAVESVRTGTLRIWATQTSRAITEADQVVVRGETWNIRGIANADDRGDMLDLVLETGGVQ